MGEVDCEDEAEEEDVCITVGRSIYLVTEASDTVADLSLWSEKTQGMPHKSCVLSHGGEYLIRRRSMAALAPACVLRLATQTEGGRPRGMLVLRRNTYVKTNGWHRHP